MTTHQEYVDAIKKSAISTGKRLLIKALVTRVPFLFWPPFGLVTSFLIGKEVEILVAETEFAIFFTYIDMRVDAQGRAFSQAAIKNYQAQLNGSPQEKSEAEKELMDSFKKFVVLKS
jgi:hypothetical protein